MTEHTKQVLPSTRRLIEGFRDTGYTFNAAVADIVDNSIAADAANVSVQVEFDLSGKPLVLVSDDGHGMVLAKLENAMRYGSDERDDPNSLGRFGLGLKTASTSFCRRLTVISQSPSADAQPVAATWDLDHVVRVNDWELFIGPASAAQTDTLDEALDGLKAMSKQPNTSGTVVVWNEVDRLFKESDGAGNRRALKRLIDPLRWHLRTVYQRFLDDADVRARNVRIFLNGEELVAWDPFCEKYTAPELEKKMKAISGNGDEADIILRAFILPAINEVADGEYRKDSRISNDRQGIYLYRENRLIEGPNWLGIGAADTHMNNLRVELSFPAQLDATLEVDIKKSRVHLDPSFADDLAKFLTPVRREAQNRARRGNARAASKSGTAATRPTEIAIGQNLPDLRLPKINKGADGSVTMTNNQGEVSLVDAGGKPSGKVRIRIDETPSTLNVVKLPNLDDGVLWEASLGDGKVQVAINTGHDWYQKAYLPNASNSPLVQALEFLFHALATVEMNNTSPELDEVFQEFRVDVSRNLKKLVRDLPEPDFDADLDVEE